MATTKDMEALGYTVNLAFVGEDSVDVLSVVGFGLRTYIKADDQEQIDSLADPVLHAKRISPPEPTVEPAPVVVPQLPRSATLADVIAAVNELSAS